MYSYLATDNTEMQLSSKRIFELRAGATRADEKGLGRTFGLRIRMIFESFKGAMKVAPPPIQSGGRSAAFMPEQPRDLVLHCSCVAVSNDQIARTPAESAASRSCGYIHDK